MRVATLHSILYMLQRREKHVRIGRIMRYAIAVAVALICHPITLELGILNVGDGILVRAIVLFALNQHVCTLACTRVALARYEAKAATLADTHASEREKRVVHSGDWVRYLPYYACRTAHCVPKPQEHAAIMHELPKRTMASRFDRRLKRRIHVPFALVVQAQHRHKRLLEQVEGITTTIEPLLRVAECCDVLMVSLGLRGHDCNRRCDLFSK